MAEKKNQHYVPQYYFKYFNNHQKFISILLINSRKIINRSSVADQASLPYFYGDSDVENKICVIENSNRKALNKIITTKRIDKKLKDEIIDTILFQHLRTAKSRQLMKNAWKTIEAFNNFHENVHNESEAKAWLKDNHLQNFEVEEKLWHQRQLSMLTNASWQLKDLDYLILDNQSELDFVFSDAPVVYLNPFMENFKEKGITGTLSKGLIVAYPISNKILILLFESEVYTLQPTFKKIIDSNNVLKVNEQIVNYFNYLQFLNAEACVYSSQLETLNLLKNESGRVSTKFTCNIELKNEGKDNAGVLFSGALDQTPNFPPPLFFNYKCAKTFREARPKALKNYKKLNEERWKRVLSKTIINQISKTKNFDELLSLIKLTV